jgi:hypothetical protein
LSDDADLRHVQIAARHADSRTTVRCARARKNLDRHPNYISLTWGPYKAVVPRIVFGILI